MKNFTAGTKKIFPAMPLWSNQLMKPGKKISNNKDLAESENVIYFATCISRMMGGETQNVFLSVCKKAKINVIIPENIKGTCCGQTFSSKGYADAFRITANKTIEKLWQHSQEGMILVVLDVTSCTQTIASYPKYLTEINKNRYDKMTFIDVIDFAAEKVLPRLNILKQKKSIVFHPVCSVYKMGSLNKLQMIGKACAEDAHIPFFAKCCGMAGDRGMLFPELTASATKTESVEVNKKNYDGYYSSSRTCEMALSESVGKNYESVLKLLDEVSG